VCLVTSSWSMARTFLTLLHVNLGFRPANVVTLNVSLQGAGYRGSEEWKYYSEALRRLRSIPGVQAAGAVSHLPLMNNVYMANAFTLDSGQKIEHILTNAVTPGYFRAMGTPFLAGHDFEDNAGSRFEASVIVNEAFAQSTGLGSAVVGRRLKATWRTGPYLIAGVVTTARLSGPAFPGGPQIFWPIEEEPPASVTFVARVPGQPEDWLARCRDTVRTVNSKVPVYDVKTLDARLSEALSRPRLYTTATAFLALLALVLAAVGNYGTAAHSIAQRRHEMGVRIAVGASYKRVRRMVLQESLRPVLLGAAAGVLLSVAAGRFMEHLLENAAGSSYATCMAAAGFLLLTGFVAVWTATRSVLSIDPAGALRAE
jgi:putative ABC transport system permease protein